MLVGKSGRNVKDICDGFINIASTFLKVFLMKDKNLGSVPTAGTIQHKTLVCWFVFVYGPFFILERKQITGTAQN